MLVKMLHESKESSDLAKEIFSFLDKHGKKNPDPDSDGIYNSPDAEMLHDAASILQANPSRLRHVPNSSWGSGGYKPYADKEAHRWHDEILEKIKKFIHK